MTGNIINRYVEWLNRIDRRNCEKLQKEIYRRQWVVTHEPKLYVFAGISFAGGVASFIFLLLAVWYGFFDELLAVPVLIFELVYFITVLLLNRIYKNR